MSKVFAYIGERQVAELISAELAYSCYGAACLSVHQGERIQIESHIKSPQTPDACDEVENHSDDLPGTLGLVKAKLLDGVESESESWMPNFNQERYVNLTSSISMI
jgi:hypothetical protein